MLPMSWCCLMWDRLNQTMIEVVPLTVSHDGFDMKDASPDPVIPSGISQVTKVTVVSGFGRDEGGTQTTNSEYR